MARTPKKSRAWLQGELDGLCGLYAIINAMVEIMPLSYSSPKKIARLNSEQLFHSLILRANTLYGVHNVLQHGLNTEDLIPLIKHAQLFMKRTHKVSIRVDRPLRHNSSRNVVQVTNILRASMVKPNVALILGIDGIFHWSTATKITETAISLRDSDKMTRIPLNRCSVSYGRSKKKYIIAKSGVFRLTRKVAS